MTKQEIIMSQNIVKIKKSNSDILFEKLGYKKMIGANFTQYLKDGRVKILFYNSEKAVEMCIGLLMDMELCSAICTKLKELNWLDEEME